MSKSVSGYFKTKKKFFSPLSQRGGLKAVHLKVLFLRLPYAFDVFQAKLVLGAFGKPNRPSRVLINNRYVDQCYRLKYKITEGPVYQ